jgi:hypothetical protein
MCPKADNLNYLFSLIYLINQSVPDINTPGIGAFQITHKFLKRWRILKRIVFEDLN